MVGFNVMREFQGVHNITLVGIEPQSGVSGFASLASEVHWIRSPDPRLGMFGRLSRSWGRLLWMMAPGWDIHANPDLRTTIDALDKEKNFDAILLFELSALRHCSHGLHSKVVVNAEDPQSIRASRMASLPTVNWFMSLRLKLSAILWRRYEAAVLGKVGKVLLLSRSDVNDFALSLRLNNVGHMSYAVRFDRNYQVIPFRDRTKVIVYSGNMFHPPNVDGALFFLGEVFPRIIERIPDVKLWIVGATPDTRILEMARKFGGKVEIKGRVESVISYVARAAVSVCPIRLKIGVQTKILEALAVGTPVVTTSAGNSGIRGRAGRDLQVTDDPDDFARRVCNLVEGKQWEGFSCNGRQFVGESFSWAKSAQELSSYIVELTRKPK